MLVASPLLAVIGARPGRVSEPARPRALVELVL